MSDKTQNLLPRLGAAERRLDRAVARLEAALERRAENSADGEVERLMAELASARQDHAQLERVTETVSGRLDAAIHRLKLVLEA